MILEIRPFLSSQIGERQRKGAGKYLLQLPGMVSVEAGPTSRKKWVGFIGPEDMQKSAPIAESVDNL